MSEREKLVEVIRETVAVGLHYGLPQVDDALVPPELAASITQAILAALEAAGVRLVPVESTMEMFAAADPIGTAAFHAGCTVNPDRIWQAMLAASPYAKENGNG